ncbi:MAG: DUF4397 domain-containing protein [Ignavibacteria bacterium]|nr:DUF4397 domain-containing protein [Ignavibacteria bacterium]
MKMQNTIKKSIGLLIFLLFSSCTCVPDIDTPKEIKASESAKVLLINANTDFEEVDVYSSEIAVLKKLSYFWFNKNYYSIGIESSHIKILNSSDKDLIYSRAIIDLDKGSKYSFIFFGNEEKASSIIVSDSIEEFNSNFAYIRFIHSSIDCKPVRIELRKDFTSSIELAQGEASDFSEYFAGSYSVDFFEKETEKLILSVKDVQFKNGSAYTILLKGSSEVSNKNLLVCEILEMPK